MAGTVSYEHTTFREAIVSGTGISSAADMTTTNVTMNRTTGSYATAPYQAVQTGAVSEAEAFSEVRYAEVDITLSTPMVLSNIKLKAARGGTSTPRGVSVYGSHDGFTTKLFGGDLTTVRPNWTQFDQNVNISVTTSIQLRLYFWGPSTSVLIDHDDLVLTFSDPGSSSHNLTINDISIGSPDIGTPAANYIRNLSISNYSVGSPNYGPVSITQRHALATANVAVGSPTAGPVTLGQRHSLGAAAFSVGSPSIGSPALGSAGTTNLTIPADVSTGSPTLGSPALKQRHGFTISGAGPSSVPIASPVFKQRHALTIADYSTASPDVGPLSVTLPDTADVVLLKENVLAADLEERVLELYEDRFLSAEIEIRRLDYA